MFTPEVLRDGKKDEIGIAFGKRGHKSVERHQGDTLFLAQCGDALLFQ